MEEGQLFRAMDTIRTRMEFMVNRIRDTLNRHKKLTKNERSGPLTQQRRNLIRRGRLYRDQLKDLRNMLHRLESVYYHAGAIPGSFCISDNELFTDLRVSEDISDIMTLNSNTIEDDLNLELLEEEYFLEYVGEIDFEEENT